eukprot:m.1442732 g.1442732  ORF g.1442732 m.1442732 type:complete len:182 (+) comp25097_c0_seq29:30-575(+)
MCIGICCHRSSSATTRVGAGTARVSPACIVADRWLTLTIFADTSILVIPSLAATIISVVPVMPSFFLALPTALGLWLSEDDTGGDSSGTSVDGWLMSSSKIDAVMFFALHFYVYWEVSPSIYEGMYMNLPYFVVSMSVVGGIVTMGLEGVIMGPMALAGFFTVVRVSRLLLSRPGKPNSVS